MLAELNQWKQPVDELRQEVQGSTNVVLNHNGCRLKECNLGKHCRSIYIPTYW